VRLVWELLKRSALPGGGLISLAGPQTPCVSLTAIACEPDTSSYSPIATHESDAVQATDRSCADAPGPAVGGGASSLACPHTPPDALATTGSDCVEERSSYPTAKH
jgi:hypothetical protein